MRPEKDRDIRSAAMQIAQKLRAVALDHGKVDTLVPPDEPQQGVAETPERRREIGPNDKLTDKT